MEIEESVQLQGRMPERVYPLLLEVPDRTGIFIPGVVFDDPRLRSNSKLLFGDVLNICHEEGGLCGKGDGYFAERYGVTQSAIGGWMRELIDCGYLYEVRGQKSKKQSRIVGVKLGVF